MPDPAPRHLRLVYLAMLSPAILMVLVFGGWGAWFAATRGLRGEEIGQAMNSVAFPAALIVFTLTFLFGRWCARRDGLGLREIGWDAVTSRHVLLGAGVGIPGALFFAYAVVPVVKLANPAYDPLISVLAVWQMLILQVVGVAGEDTVFRGYPLTRLRERFKPWSAVAIAAIFYALLNFTQGPVAAAWAYVMGLGFGALFLWTRSLWPVAIAHYLVAVIPRGLNAAGLYQP